MGERVVIDKRFCGPAGAGHGGYVCGVVAGLVGGPVEVTLRRPVPLDRPLQVRRVDGGGVELRDGEALLAEGLPAVIEVAIPETVSVQDARTAVASYLGFRWHPYPTCFGCGPQRAEGDGLRIFSGPVPGRDLVAAPWSPDSSLLDVHGNVRPEFLSAALDCPGGWAAVPFLGAGERILLGRFGVRVMGSVMGNEHCVVIGWPKGAEGRKLYTGAALLSETGAVRAVGGAVWIKLALTENPGVGGRV